jgi:hypothetical protein
MVSVDTGGRCFAVLEVKFFWYCLGCTSEYAEARVEACVEVASFLPQHVGIELYLNDNTVGQLGLAQSGSNSSHEGGDLKGVAASDPGLRRRSHWLRGGTCNPCPQHVVAAVAA